MATFISPCSLQRQTALLNEAVQEELRYAK